MKKRKELEKKLQLKKKNKKWEKAIKIIPGGNMLYSKRAELFLPKFWPTYFSKTKDAFVWDIDGCISLTTRTHVFHFYKQGNGDGSGNRLED